MRAGLVTKFIGTPQEKLEAKMANLAKITNQISLARKAAIESALKAVSLKRKKMDALAEDISALEQLVEVI